MVPILNEDLKTRCKKVLKSTVRVLRDCSVRNGAIVAANTDMEYYPKDVSPYRFVWIRDAASALPLMFLKSVALQV